MSFDVKSYLEKKNISYKVHKHPPVFTCEEAEKYYSEIKGINSKNLFIKNRKNKKFFLLILPSQRKLDMKEFGSRLNEKLKFANENNLKEILGLTPGSVSPFGLINDKEHITKVLIDQDIWDSDIVSFHPNINTETLELNGKDFQKFIKTIGNTFELI